MGLRPLVGPQAQPGPVAHRRQRPGLADRLRRSLLGRKTLRGTSSRPAPGNAGRPVPGRHPGRRPPVDPDGGSKSQRTSPSVSRSTPRAFSRRTASRPTAFALPPMRPSGSNPSSRPSSPSTTPGAGGGGGNRLARCRPHRPQGRDQGPRPIDPRRSRGRVRRPGYPPGRPQGSCSRLAARWPKRAPPGGRSLRGSRRRPPGRRRRRPTRPGTPGRASRDRRLDCRRRPDQAGQRWPPAESPGRRPGRSRGGPPLQHRHPLRENRRQGATLPELRFRGAALHDLRRRRFVPGRLRL